MLRMLRPPKWRWNVLYAREDVDANTEQKESRAAE